MASLNPNFGATPPLIQEDELARVPPVWKVPVKVATTGAITLSGLQTIDGVVLVEHDLVLVKNQAGGITNGIYIAQSVAWLRSPVLIALTLATGVTVYVAQGTVNADKVFICTNPPATGITSVDNLVFTLLSSTTGGPASGTNGSLQYNNNGVLAGDSSTTNGSGTITNVVSFNASGAITGGTLTDGTFTTTGGAVTSATIIGTSNNVAANSLKTTGAVVNVSAAAPPTTGQVLTATGATTATWQASAGTLARADFYGLTAGVGNSGSTDYAATIPVSTSVADQGVPFPRIALSGTGFTQPTARKDAVQIAAIGTYHVSFSVHTTEAGQLNIEKSTDSGSTWVAWSTTSDFTAFANMNPTSGGHPIIGNCYITTAAINTWIRVANCVGNSAALTITPANGSQTHANAQHLVITSV